MRGDSEEESLEPAVGAEQRVRRLRGQTFSVLRLILRAIFIRIIRPSVREFIKKRRFGLCRPSHRHRASLLIFIGPVQPRALAQMLDTFNGYIKEAERITPPPEIEKGMASWETSSEIQSASLCMAGGDLERPS